MTNLTQTIVRYSWLLILISGIALSLLQYNYMRDMDRQMLSDAIAERSQVKLDSIRKLLQQHGDITRLYLTFVRNDLQNRGVIEKNEIITFSRSLMATHSDDLYAAMVLPPKGMGSVMLMKKDGSISDILPANIRLPAKDASDGLQISIRDNKIIRFVSSGMANDATAYVVCDWSIEALIRQAIETTRIAGLDVRLTLETTDKPVTVFFHRSRAGRTENLLNEHTWQGSFNIRNARFTVHTRATESLVRQFSGFRPLGALLAGLMITMLLTLFIFNRIRANIILDKKVEVRTHALSAERAKLAAVIDYAKDAILLVNEQGNILRNNPAACAIFGYEKQEWDQLTVHDLVPARTREQHQQWFDAEVDGQTDLVIGQVRELHAQRKDGTVFPCEITVTDFIAAGARHFSVMLSDITAFQHSQWRQQTLLHLRAVSQRHTPLHPRLKKMLSAMLDCPWPITAAAIYIAQKDQLWLIASQGWRADEKRRHSHIATGRCLCGEPTEGPHMPCATTSFNQHHRTVSLPVMHEEHQIGLLYLQLSNDNTMPKIFSDFCQQVYEIITATLVREHVRQVLEGSESKHRQLVETTPIGIIIQSGGIIQYANPAAQSMLGIDDSAPLLQRELLPIVHPDDRATFDEMMQRLQQGNHVEPAEMRMQQHDGNFFWAEIRGVPVVYESNPSVQVLIHNISDRKMAEEELTRLSYTDALTGLPNRRLYMDRLEQACNMAMRSNRQLCLLYLDLDRFKAINDTQGHACGDLVLKTVATRIQDTLRASDTAARMGGDEFAILLPETDMTSALRVANKLSGILQQPMTLSGQKLSIGASIGLASYPEDGLDSDTLLRHADNAMYHAKQKHMGIHCFSAEMEESARHHIQLEGELREADKRGQFELYYQAQYRLDDNGTHFTGVESLIRWKHPELGMISPAEFIPIAEEAGLIRSITGWVIGEASRQALLWQQQGYRPNKIGINVSAAELMHIGLAEDILAHISKAGANPEWFEIEITETA
ncbi:MAG: diguanylate cyclase, partial [Mariprofundus sp.]|nr:diguanylate cyclase [Mariprofundus sp.]